MTEDERNVIIQGVINELKSNSQDVTSVEEVTSIDGVDSLPGTQGNTLVRVPITMLTNKAEEALKEAKSVRTYADNISSDLTDVQGDVEAIQTELSEPISTDKIADKAITAKKIADGVIKSTEWNNIAEFSGFTDESAETTSPIKKNFGGYFWSSANKCFLGYNTIDKKFYYPEIFLGGILSLEASNNSIISSEKHLYVHTAQNKIYRWDSTSKNLVLVGEPCPTITTEKIANKAVTIEKLDLKGCSLFVKEDSGASLDISVNQDGQMMVSIPYLTADGKVHPEEVEIPVATTSKNGVMSAADKSKLDRTLSFPGTANADANKAISTGIYPWVTQNVPVEGKGFLIQTLRTTTAVYNQYYSTQMAFGMSDEVKGKVYIRQNSQKAGTYNYGDWIELTGGSSSSGGTGSDSSFTDEDIKNIVDSVFDEDTISDSTTEDIVNSVFDEKENEE